MTVLFMVMSFIDGCVDWMCQSFLSRCVVFVFFFNHSFWPRCHGFLTFPCRWEISFF